MSGKLKYSQLRINELEKELAQTRSNSTDTQKNAQQIQQIYDELEKKYYELRYYTHGHYIFLLKSFNLNTYCKIIHLFAEKKRKIWN